MFLSLIEISILVFYGLFNNVLKECVKKENIHN